MSIVHVWSEYARRPGDQRRHDNARSTWPRAFQGKAYRQAPVHEKDLPRNAKSIGDGKPLPFLKDVIERAIANSQADDNEIIVLTNDDIHIAEGTGLLVHDAVFGWASRRDFISTPRRLDMEAVAKGQHHGGVDMLFFPAGKWAVLRTLLPDFLLAREAWDLVARDVFRRKGGKELCNVLGHTLHIQDWMRMLSHPSSRWNNGLAQAYAESVGLTEINQL